MEHKSKTIDLLKKGVSALEGKNVTRKASADSLQNYLDSYTSMLKKAEDIAQHEQYTYRPALNLFVTNEYTHPSAWAHTVPSEKNMCVRPWEFIDYWLGFLRVLGHEVGHNILHYFGLPDGDEDRHTRHAYQNLKYSPFEIRSSHAYS